MYELRFSIWLVLCVACSGEPSRLIDAGSSINPNPRELCPGGTRTTLSATYRSTAPETPEEAFATANGRQFLLVNGDCKFWVNTQSWFTMSGQLSESDVIDLTELLHYEDLPKLDGTWRNDCYDPAMLAVSDTESVVKCDCDCSDSSTPQAVRDLSQGFWKLLPKLAKSGGEWSGAAIVLVLQDDTLEDQDALPGPDGVEVDTVLTPADEARETITAGEKLKGVAIAKEHADQFRELMVEYFVRYSERAVAGNPLPLVHEGVFFGVYLRDDLHFSGTD